MRLIALALFGLAVLGTTLSNAFAQGAHGGSGGASHSGSAPHPGPSGPSHVGSVGSRPAPAPRPVPPPVSHPQHGPAVLVPVPVYYGSYYYGGSYYGGDGGNNYAQAPAPSYDYGLADATGQSPVAITNPGYRTDSANPVMRDYSDGQLPPPGPEYQPNDQPTIYLLAMTDHNIVPAIAYWVDGDTLTYITTEGSENRVSLSLIDRDFSKSLNDTRGVEFKLPVAK